MAEEYGLPILLKFYQEYAGKYRYATAGAEMLCRDLNVDLREDNKLEVLNGRFNPPSPASRYEKATIEIPWDDEPAVRGFLIYHELAHWRMYTGHDWFRAKLPLSCNSRTKEEYWCDAFATAMVFAWAGVNLLSRENHKDFFTAGTENEKGRLSGTELKHLNDRRDIFQGYRMSQLNNEHFKVPHVGIAELANELLLQGAWRLGKTF